MNTYSIKILAMQVIPSINGQTEVVEKVTFAVVATDQNGNSAQVSHDYWTDINNLTGFIPYPTLTEAQVQQWITAGFNPLSIQSLQNDAANLLLEKTSPQSAIVALPWQTS